MRICGLAVEFCEGEGPGVAEERVEIVDGVEDCYYVEEGGQTADDVLCEDRFGDVDSGSGDLFREMSYAVTVPRQ